MRLCKHALVAGARPNLAQEFDEDRSNALQLAVASKDGPLVELLLAADADPTMSLVIGRTLLVLAVKCFDR